MNLVVAMQLNLQTDYLSSNCYCTISLTIMTLED
jgi:hypothetical protein